MPTNNGQLTRWKYKGHDIIFYSPADEVITSLIEKGAYPSPGFQMYPRIGTIPGYTGEFEGRKFSLDGHGISRLIKFTQGKQEYNKEKIKNPKAGNGHPEYVYWPYSYALKSMITSEKSIRHDFILEGERQPFQFGTHPNFLLPKDPSKAWLECKGRIEIMDIVKRDRMLPIENADEITLVDEERGFRMVMKTYGFGNFQLWTNGTEYARHMCIEPVTHVENDKGFVEGNYLWLDEYRAGYEISFETLS